MKGIHACPAPSDDFNRRADWYDIFAPYGWVPVRQQGAVTYWRRRIWEGTAGELLAVLEKPPAVAPRAWPDTPQALRNVLRRLTPNLSATGIEVTSRRKPGGMRRRLITLRMAAQADATTEERGGDDRDDRDAKIHAYSVNAKNRVVKTAPYQEKKTALENTSANYRPDRPDRPTTRHGKGSQRDGSWCPTVPPTPIGRLGTSMCRGECGTIGTVGTVFCRCIRSAKKCPASPQQASKGCNKGKQTCQANIAAVQDVVTSHQTWRCAALNAWGISTNSSGQAISARSVALADMGTISALQRHRGLLRNFVSPARRQSHYPQHHLRCAPSVS